MAVAPQIQQRLPFVDDQGRLSNEGLRALNDAFRVVVDALDQAIAAQAAADQAQNDAIAAAQAAADAALAAADAALAAADALLAAATASGEAAAAQGVADNALSLATTAVQQDVGPSWSPASGTASRATFITYTGQTISNPPTQAEVQAIDSHLVILSQRMKAMIDDLTANGALA